MYLLLKEYFFDRWIFLNLFYDVIWEKEWSILLLNSRLQQFDTYIFCKGYILSRRRERL